MGVVRATAAVMTSNAVTDIAGVDGVNAMEVANSVAVRATAAIMTTDAVTDTAGADDANAMAVKVVVVRANAAIGTTNAVTGSVGTDVVSGVAVVTADAKESIVTETTTAAATAVIASGARGSTMTQLMTHRLLTQLSNDVIGRRRAPVARFEIYRPREITKLPSTMYSTILE